MSPKASLLREPQLLAKVEVIKPDAVFLSAQAHVLQFHRGWCTLDEIVPRVHDCVLLAMLSIPSSTKIMVWDEASPIETDVPLQQDTALLIAGKCKLWVGPQDEGRSDASTLPLQCVAFCLAGM